MNSKRHTSGYRALGLAAVLLATLSLAVLSLMAATSMAVPVKLKRGQDRIDVTIGGRPFTTYYFLPDVAKPYLMPLQTASGIVISRPFPVGNYISEHDLADPGPNIEPHQRPLYFAHGDINGLDFWGELATEKYLKHHKKNLAAPVPHHAFGHMSLMKVEEVREGPESATVRARFSLEDESNHKIAEETQTYTFSGDDQTRTIDCEYIISATAGPVVMGDTKEGTFGIRLSRELSEPHDHMLNSHGAQGEPAIWGKTADWVDYSGIVSGKPVGIVAFDSPKSFRHPTTWHARAYGLLAANPFGLREFTKDPKQDGSYTIQPGQSLTFQYRVVIYDGELTPSRIAHLYRHYATRH